SARATPGTREAKPSSKTRSGRGKGSTFAFVSTASMSARYATVGPSAEPSSTATIPWPPTPVVTSSPAARSCCATSPAVSRSSPASSGRWWISRRSSISSSSKFVTAESCPQPPTTRTALSVRLIGRGGFPQIPDYLHFKRRRRSQMVEAQPSRSPDRNRGRSFLNRPPSAQPPDTPEAERGEQGGQNGVEGGLDPLQRPVAISGLIGDVDVQVERREASPEGREGRVTAALDRDRSSADHLVPASQDFAGLDRLAGAVQGWRLRQVPGAGRRGQVDGHRAGHLPGAIESQGLTHRGLIDRHRGDDRGHHVWADQDCHDELNGDEDREGGGHRGQGAPEQQAEGDAEREGEGGVAERHDVARVERLGAEPVAGHGVERAGPPRHQEADDSGGRDGGQRDGGELDCEPAGAGHRLVPGHVVRAALEFSGDQRRAPEDPDQAWGSQHE